VSRVASYLLVVLVLALGAGCTSDTDGEAQAPASSSGTGSASSADDYQPTKADRAAIRHVLVERARALTAGDTAAFMATVDRADPEFVRRQRTLFANLTALPLQSVRYRVDDASGLPPADVKGGDPVFRPYVVEQVRLRDVDQAPVGNPLGDTFVRRDDRWLLGAENLPGSHEDSDEPQSRPWAGPKQVAVARSGHLVVIVDEDDADTAQSLADTVADDVRFDAGVLGLPAEYDVLVDATSTGEVHNMNTVDDREAAAVTFPVFGMNTDGRFTRLAGVRIKINPEDAEAIVADPHVVRHELTHYLTLTSLLGAPTWLREGLAEYVSVQPAGFEEVGVPEPVAAHVMNVPRDLPTTGRWGLDPDADYLIARAAVTHLVDTYGMDAVMDLAKEYRRIPGDDPDQKTDRVLRRSLGLTEPALVAATWDLLGELG
jgi:hypothetical protein